MDPPHLQGVASDDEVRVEVSANGCAQAASAGHYAFQSTGGKFDRAGEPASATEASPVATVHGVGIAVVDGEVMLTRQGTTERYPLDAHERPSTDGQPPQTSVRRFLYSTAGSQEAWVETSAGSGCSLYRYVGP